MIAMLLSMLHPRGASAVDMNNRARHIFIDELPALRPFPSQTQSTPSHMIYATIDLDRNPSPNK